MNSPLPLLTDFSDRLSPMVVKEMRQGLRTRFFTAALILFHVTLGLLMLGFLMDVRAQDAHEMFWIIIATTLLGILPARGWNALHTEAKDGTLDMLVLTGMSSFRIVWGKWVSLYSQTLLVVSSLLPYMIARYQLGGVEIVRELVALYLLILGSAVITAAMVAFSSQSLKMIRLLFSALVGLVAFGFGIFAFALTFSSVRFYEDLMPSGLAERFMLWGGVTVLSAYLVYILLCIGSGQLPATKQSQGSVKRIVALAVLSLMTLGIWGLYLQSPRYSQATMGMAFMVLVGLVLLIGMDVLTEAAPLFYDVEKLRKSSSMKSLFEFGWPSGVFFYTLICFLPLCALMAVELRSGRAHNYYKPLCMLSCVLIANLVPICVPIFRKESRLGQWLVCQFLAVAISLIIAIVLEGTPFEIRATWCYFSIITPVSVIFGDSWGFAVDQERFFLFGTAISLFWVLAAMFSALREMRKLRALAITSDSSPPPPHDKHS
jgi:hypothetical protein